MIIENILINKKQCTKKVNYIKKATSNGVYLRENAEKF